MRIISLLIIAIYFLTTPIYAQLSGVEKKITKIIDQNNQEAEVFLKELVNINSGTMNFDGVRQVADVLIPEFEELGFETSFITGKDWGRAGHLVAKHQGSGKGPRLLLIGHLDTVFEPDNPFQEFTMKNDSILTGPGVVDMKGGDVIALFALRALKEAGVLKDMTIEVVYTGDEEKSGSPLSLSKKALIEAAERADIAIGFENGDSNPATAVISRRGSTSWELKVKGTPAHSSQIFSDGIGAGAIYEAARVLTQFYDRLKMEEYLTFNPGVILGGTQVTFDAADDGGSASGKTNVVAQNVIVHGDLRAISPEQLNHARSIMREVISESLTHTTAELNFSNSGYPPLAPSEGNHKLLTVYDKVSRDLGFGTVGVVEPINAGAADISFTSGLVDGAIDGLGLSGGNDHTINEFGNLRWLPRLTKRAAVFMYRVTQR